MPTDSLVHPAACLCQTCHDARMEKARAVPVDPVDEMPSWLSKTLAYPHGDVHQARLFITGEAWRVVEEARVRIGARVGQDVTLGQAVELLAAEYLAS